MKEVTDIRFDPFCPIIQQDLDSVFRCRLPWDNLKGKHIVITGATGMLAAYIAEVLLSIEAVKVTVLVRNVQKAQTRFARFQDRPDFRIHEIDLMNKIIDLEPCSILIHAASIPRPDTKIPVDVLAPNIIGTWNLLEYVRKCPDFEQFIYFSSGAVYGENITYSAPIKESDYYPIPFNSVKACYAIGKMTGENICACFMKQYGIPVKTVRYAHTYGPGMDIRNDPRSFVDFMRKLLNGENIELLSAGDMIRHFCYISDATAAFFHVLFSGVPGDAYNIANPDAGISIANQADLLVEISPVKGQRVVRRVENQNSGYAPQQYVGTLDITKLKMLGWSPETSVRAGFLRTIQCYS